MLNSCVVVGKVLKKPEWKENENAYVMLIECYRPFAMEDGHVDKDVFSVVLWKGLANQCGDMCKKGDVVGIKGRLEMKSIHYENQDLYLSKIIAEKLTFLFVDGKTNGIMY